VAATLLVGAISGINGRATVEVDGQIVRVRREGDGSASAPGNQVFPLSFGQTEGF
jgi:hypothetical protein